MVITTSCSTTIQNGSFKVSMVNQQQRTKMGKRSQLRNQAPILISSANSHLDEHLFEKKCHGKHVDATSRKQGHPWCLFPALTRWQSALHSLLENNLLRSQNRCCLFAQNNIRKFSINSVVVWECYVMKLAPVCCCNLHGLLSLRVGLLNWMDEHATLMLPR